MMQFNGFWDVADVWDVFEMLMCVLSFIGSWFGCPQTNLSCWELVMMLFLSFGVDMVMILVIQVIVVQFTFLVDIFRSCSMHIGGSYWLLCALLNIFMVRWCSLCYVKFLMVVACCGWPRHNYWRCHMFAVLIEVHIMS